MGIPFDVDDSMGEVTMFPQTKFVKQNTIEKQIKHIASELVEVNKELDDRNWERLAEELMDLQHSADTALHILASRYGIELDKVRNYIILKNTARLYY